MASLLTLKNICKHFPNVIANDNISFAIDEGKIHALLGENGAGKSTLVQMIYGTLQPTSGEMRWQGDIYKPKNPNDARQLGIGMVFQHFSLFESMNVAENIALNLHGQIADSAFIAKITELSQKYGLEVDPKRNVGDLSVGARQRVEIIRCLMQSPKLLIMDEPTSVLTPQEVDELFVTLRRLADEGCAILYISHKLEEIRQLCQYATILRAGKLVDNCVPQKLSKHELAEMMLGKKIALPERKKPKLGKEIFKIDGLNRPRDDIFGVDIQNLSLILKSGSITGIAGVAGNGQNELMNALIGEQDTQTGSLIYQDKDISALDPHQRRQLGIYFIPEERHGHGAVPSISLTQNMLLSRPEHASMTKNGFINHHILENLANKVIEAFHVKTPSCHVPAKMLSGGNLQKFIMGREILHNPDLLIVSQPTWGIDVGSASHIHHKLIELADNGTAILLISQDLDEILSLCDHVHVLANGKLSDGIAIADVDIGILGALMEGKTETEIRNKRATKKPATNKKGKK
ncbi:MAG: ABC transporter ATP-binding protein [Alphaproteobacteria bacterium]|nr:ABC transporter ATP-binding protein [Alphaproteobacteria bacterium]